MAEGLKRSRPPALKEPKSPKGRDWSVGPEGIVDYGSEQVPAKEWVKGSLRVLSWYGIAESGVDPVGQQWCTTAWYLGINSEDEKVLSETLKEFEMDASRPLPQVTAGFRVFSCLDRSFLRK